MEDTAARLAAYADVLRTLVVDGLRRLPAEPRLHVKRLLAEQAFEDARSALKLRRRIAELPETAPAEPVEPSPAGLAAAVRAHLAALDPLADPHTHRLLVQLAHRQERHAEELPAVGGADAVPARDPWVEIADGAPADPVNDELLAAEVAASLAEPDADWDLLADLARLAADRLTRAVALDGPTWGVEPVDVSPFAAARDGGRPAALAFAAVPGDRAHERIVQRWG